MKVATCREWGGENTHSSVWMRRCEHRLGEGGGGGGTR